MTDTVTEGDRILVRVPLWLMKANDLVSRELIGGVARVTEKAVLLNATVSIRAAEKCLRCGRQIDNPISRTVGYGPDCSEILGIPRDLTADQLDGHRDRITVEQQRSLWLPLSRIEITDPDNPDVRWDTDADNTAAKRVGAVVANGKIRLKTAYEHRDLAKSIGSGTWRKTEGRWEFPASPATASRIAEAFADHGLAGDEGFNRLLADSVIVEQAQGRKTAEDLPAVPGSKTDAWLHQRQAFWFAENLQAAALFMEMGTGKSKVACDLIVHRGHMLTLIVAPLAASRVWPQQFRLHAGSDVRVVKLTGRGRLQRKVAEALEAIELCRATKTPLVLIINYESVWRDAFAEFVLGQTWDLLVLDESHKIKGAKAKASVFLAKVARAGKARHRLLLTGTPMPHSPLDIYGQYRFLDPGIFGTSFNRFKLRYCVYGGYGDYEVKGYTMTEVDPKTKQPNPYYNPAIEKEWNDRVWSVAYHVDADVLDLPPVTHVERFTELEPKTRKMYAELDQHMVMQAGEGLLTTDNALTKLLRLQQMTSGHLKDDDGERIILGDEKKRLLDDVLDELPVDEPVVVFCRFTPDLDAVREIAEKQGREYGELSGRRKDGLTEDALMNPDIDVLGVQIQSGGTGIDLTRAHYGIYYSVGYSLGDFDQSAKRQDRPGQTHSVTFIHLIVEDSIDEQVYAALRGRKDVVDYVLDDMKHRHQGGDR